MRKRLLDDTATSSRSLARPKLCNSVSGIDFSAHTEINLQEHAHMSLSRSTCSRRKITHKDDFV